MTRYQQPRQPDPDAWLLTLVDDENEDGQPAYNANRLIVAMRELVNNAGEDEAAEMLAAAVPALDFAEWKDLLS